MEGKAEDQERLTMHARRMKELSDELSYISRRVNFLAFNGVVEATRVGDMSKGLSVVATEFRKLAENFAEVSLEIQIVVKELEKAFNYE